jgi:hypothetical protein
MPVGSGSGYHTTVNWVQLSAGQSLESQTVSTDSAINLRGNGNRVVNNTQSELLMRWAETA